MSLHALDRARERYGVSLTFTDLFEIVSKIEEGKAALVSRAEENVFRYLVEHRGIRFKVVYDSRARTVVTFLRMGDRDKPRQKERAPRKRYVRRKGRTYVAGSPKLDMDALLQ